MKTKKIGQVKFFQACEALRNHREEIEKTCSNMIQAAGFLAAKVGGNVSAKSTLLDIMEATGITLTFPRKPTGGDTTAQSKKDKAIIIGTIHQLAEEMGIKLTPEFVELHRRAFGNLSKPIPVSKVAPASTLQIAK